MRVHKVLYLVVLLSMLPHLTSLFVLILGATADDATILIDDGSGIGRKFDGIGGLSGGGVSDVGNPCNIY